MFYFWQSDWKSTHCTLLKQQLWYCHITMLCHRQYILHVLTFRQVFVKLISKLLSSMINIKDRVRPQKLQPLKAIHHTLKWSHTILMLIEDRFHLCSRKLIPDQGFTLRRCVERTGCLITESFMWSETIAGQKLFLALFMSSKMFMYFFLQSKRNGFLMKTLQDLYHIVIFNVLQTVEGQNEFQCSFKGL